MKTTYFIFLVSLMALGCDLKEPVAPSWTIAGSAPLFNGRFSAAELVESADSTLIAENNRIFFVKSLDLKRTELVDSVNVDDKSFEGSIAIDSIIVSGFETDTLGIQATALDDNLPNGTYPQLPAFNFTLNNVDFEGLGEFESALLKQDQFITLTIKNDLPFRIDLLTMRIRNPSTGTIIYESADSIQVRVGRTRQVEIPVGEKRVTSDFRINFTGRTPGRQTAFTISDQTALKFVISSGEIQVQEAKATIKASSYESSSTIDADNEDFTPKLISIKSGVLKYEINNKSNLKGKATFTITSLKDGDKPFQEQIIIAAARITRGEIPLQGFTLTPEGYPTKPEIGTETTFFLDESTTPVNVKETDEILYTVTLSKLEPAYLEGIFKERTAEADQDTSTVEWPSDLRNTELEFDEATVTATIYNTVGLDASVVPKIAFDYGSGPVDSLRFSAGKLPIVVDAATQAIGVQKTVQTFNFSDVPDFNKIFNKKPVEIRYSASATGAKGGNKFGYIADTSSVRGTVDIKVPLRFKTATGYERDTLIEMDSQELTGVREAIMNIRYQSRLPYAVSFALGFSDKDSVELFRLPGVGVDDRFIFKAGTVGADGRTTGYSTDVVISALNEDQIKLLEQVAFLRLILHLTTADVAGPSGGFSELLDTDHLIISVMGQMKYRVNEE